MPFSALSPAEDTQLADPVKKETYWPQLDGLRTVAFLLVLVHHLGPVTASNGPNLPVHIWLLNSVCSWGGSGVDLFFCLSGFLITFLLLSEKAECGNISFKLFFVRRALRIWPVYYALLFLSCVALPLVNWSHLNQKLYGEFCLKQALPMVLFLGNYSLIVATKVLINFNNNLGTPIIYFLLPLWSLAVEEQFYFTWPFIIRALRKPKNILCTIAALTLFSIACRWGLWYISRYVWHLPFPMALYYQSTVSHLDPLMAGAAIAVTTYHYPAVMEAARKYTPHMMLALTAIVGGIFCYFPDLKYNTYYNVIVFALIALGSLLTLAVTLLSPTCKKMFGAAPLAYFGRLTYAMYLVHYFAIAFGDGLIAKLPPAAVAQLPVWPLRFAVSLGLTSAFAFISWHLLESRFLSLRKNFRRKAT